MDFFMTFMLPILIVMAIAAFGVCIGVLGDKFEVKQDERVERYQHLAGVNCDAVMLLAFASSSGGRSDIRQMQTHKGR